MDCIFQHYVQDLTREQVTVHLGMTPIYLSCFSRRTTGCDFVESINRLCVSRSYELLARNELPMTEVCFESGLSNLSSLNRRFRQLKDMTPTDYRHLVAQRLTEQNLF